MWRCRTTSRVSTDSTDSLKVHQESCSGRPGAALVAGGDLGLPHPNISQNLPAAVWHPDASARKSWVRPVSDSDPMSVDDGKCPLWTSGLTLMMPEKPRTRTLLLGAQVWKSLLSHLFSFLKARFYRDNLDQTDAFLIEIAMQIVGLCQNVISNQHMHA